MILWLTQLTQLLWQLFRRSLALDSFVIQHLLMGVASPFKEEWMNCLATWQHLAFTRCNFVNRVVSLIILIFPIKSHPFIDDFRMIYR